MGDYKLVEVKIVSVCAVVCTAVIWRILILNMGIVLPVFCVLGTVPTCVYVSSKY
jgi:Flp pilus assembly protein TadB